MLASYPHENRARTRRDEAAEELERALNESLQPDFLAEIVAAEMQMRQLNVAAAHRQTAVVAPLSPQTSTSLKGSIQDEDDDLVDTDGDATALACESTVPDDVDLNADVPFCNLPERMLLLLLEFLDEDSIGLFGSVCHRFHATARSDSVWAMMCKRVFSVQSSGRAVQLRRYKSWAHMFLARPRVKYQGTSIAHPAVVLSPTGFYVLRITYYKTPEINMWSDLPKNAILQAIYYRYFCFKRDGTVLYAMTHRHPREMAEGFLHRHKDVFQGRFSFQKGVAFVDVNVGHSLLQFEFRLATRWRAPNTRLVLLSHALYNPNDIMRRHPHYFDTAEEEFNFRRHWVL
ncbi:Aste57867_8099 [Aphanomyces stellatus]|uniref:Aste57867_8099 protein n=1 Tax=Aphanomyces stellatus TaxID=120398 RepID=A0A485KJE3_9STRA|nr:hypothetical protein As57867_008069 [Aphanomyces stellatus]VFT84988.1 Aste57867_8099 [Aphanomyces stellatus]